MIASNLNETNEARQDPDKAIVKVCLYCIGLSIVLLQAYRPSPYTRDYATRVTSRVEIACYIPISKVTGP